MALTRDEVSYFLNTYEETLEKLPDSDIEERHELLSEHFGNLSLMYGMLAIYHGDIAEYDFEPELNDEEDLYRRLPELEYIENEEIRDETVKVFMEECPESFWTAPASSSGKNHKPSQRGPHGEWYHVKNAAEAFERMSHSPWWGNKIDEDERDAGRAAVLLHDLYKTEDYENHDTAFAEYLENETRFPDIAPETIGCVAKHMGPYNSYPPQTEETEEIWDDMDLLPLLVHMADMITSANELYTGSKDGTMLDAIISQNPEENTQ